jgi:hypothetical protein
VQFPSAVHPSFGGDDIASFRYVSKLHSIEANFRRQVSCRVSVLAGFRWIELSEDFGVLYETNPNIAGPSRYRVDVNNHLYGFQVGADALLWNNNCWLVDASVRAGVFGNNADQTTLEHYVEFGGLPAAGTASGTDTSFLGELEVTATRCLTDRLSLRLGYQMLWLEGVALAPNQIDNTNLSPPPGVVTLDTDSGFFAHGAFVGLEAVW